MNYEVVIGLEVHVQLKTQSKIFCSCSTEFGKPPNANTCPICLGMPGVLPVMNKKVVEYAIKACLATHCEVQTTSRFARKNYFYPDLPKGYQITQFELPIGLNGHINIETDGTPKKIGLTRIHLEEDAGKSIHGENLGMPGKSYVAASRICDLRRKRGSTSSSSRRSSTTPRSATSTWKKAVCDATPTCPCALSIRRN
jgi:aspartyl-tRNA(Asn)/glutamyl-tRNA(Gln) amidotransferase subunit B